MIRKLSMLDTEVPANAELQYPTTSHCLQASEGRNIFNTEVKSARKADRKHLKEKKKHFSWEGDPHTWNYPSM